MAIPSIICNVQQPLGAVLQRINNSPRENNLIANKARKRRKISRQGMALRPRTCFKIKGPHRNLFNCALAKKIIQSFTKGDVLPKGNQMKFVTKSKNFAVRIKNKNTVSDLFWTR